MNNNILTKLKTQSTKFRVLMALLYLFTISGRRLSFYDLSHSLNNVSSFIQSTLYQADFYYHHQRVRPRVKMSTFTSEEIRLFKVLDKILETNLASWITAAFAEQKLIKFLAYICNYWKVILISSTCACRVYSYCIANK
jgi:hypothetical protein